MQGRAPALDGLRGLAVVAVMSAHATAYLGLGPYTSGGSVGVLVFFVLSGFLITGQVWDRDVAAGRYTSFLRRRAVRLLPAIGVLVVVGVPLAALTDGSWRQAALGGLLTLTQTMGFVSATGVHPNPAWSVTWSLTVEWLFYLMAPLVILWWRRRGLSAARAARVAALLALGGYVIALPLPPAAFYYSPLANLAVMWAGAALALHRRAGSTRPLDPAWTAFALVLVVTLTALPSDPSSGVYWRTAALPTTVLAAVLLIRGSVGTSSPPRILSRGPLPHLGIRAYSIYLWHLPVWWTVIVTTDLPPLLTALVCLAPTALVVELSYRLLEAPALRPSRRGVATPVAALGATPGRAIAASTQRVRPTRLSSAPQAANPPAA